jgi:hypothetical protein
LKTIYIPKPALVAFVVVVALMFLPLTDLFSNELQSQDIPDNLHCVHNPINNIYMCEGE